MTQPISQPSGSEAGAGQLPEDLRRAVRRSAVAAGVVTLATRLPFAARRMWDHDSIQFALGVERYDLAAHHPHPPGYPLYIGLLKLLAAAGVDSLHGMVALAVLASALGAALMVPLTVRLTLGPAPLAPPAPGARGQGGGDHQRSPRGAGGRASRSGLGWRGALWAGRLAASLFAFNPLLWFYGELPLIYAVEGGLSVVLAHAALRGSQSRRWFLSGCVLLAVAGGVRQTTMVLLGPLFVYALALGWRRGVLGLRTILAGVTAGALVVLAWFVPLCALAGGLGAYRRISGEHFRTLLPYTSILFGGGPPALAHNLEILTKWLLQGILPGCVALAALWLAAPRTALPGLRQLAARGIWLLVWALPPVLFFALFHITKAGYTLVHLPAALVALAVAALPSFSLSRWRGPEEPRLEEDRGRLHEGVDEGRGISARRGGRIWRGGDWLGAAGVAIASLVGAAVFLFGSDRRPDQTRLWAIVRHEFNRGAIAAYESDLDRLRRAVLRYSPQDTVLATIELSGTGAAGAEGFLYPWQRHLQWYFPAYPVLFLVPEQGFAEVTRGHRPFIRVRAAPGGGIDVPAGTRRLVLVLSGPTGDRLRLPPGPAVPLGRTFLMIELPFAPESRGLHIGPLTLLRERRAA